MLQWGGKRIGLDARGPGVPTSTGPICCLTLNMLLSISSLQPSSPQKWRNHHWESCSILLQARSQDRDYQAGDHCLQMGESDYLPLPASKKPDVSGQWKMTQSEEAIQVCTAPQEGPQWRAQTLNPCHQATHCRQARTNADSSIPGT